MENIKNYLAILLICAVSLPLMGSEVDAKDQAVATSTPLTVLVTGANRGLGLGLASRYKKEGYQVIATARRPEQADALKRLGVRVEQLDVTDSLSVRSLAERLKGQALSLLINNAGIGGHSTANFSELDVDQLVNAFQVNSLGALRVTQALLPNLQAGNEKKVINISSRMGSIAQNQRSSALGYRASKAALNSFNKSLSNEFADQGYTFVVLHPGWVRTDMTSDRATYSPDESAEILFGLIEGLNEADSGSFLDLHGTAIDW